MQCPKCQAQVPDEWLDCPACGIVFAKWKTPEPEPEAPSPSPAGDDVLLPEPENAEPEQITMLIKKPDLPPPPPPASKAVTAPKASTRPTPPRPPAPISPRPKYKKMGWGPIVFAATAVFFLAFGSSAWMLYQDSQVLVKSLNTSEFIKLEGVPLIPPKQNTDFPPGVLEAQFDTVINLPFKPSGLVWQDGTFLIGRGSEPWGFARVDPKTQDISDVILLNASGSPYHEDQFSANDIAWTGEEFVALAWETWYHLEEVNKMGFRTDSSKLSIRSKQFSPDNLGGLAWDGTDFWAGARQDTRDSDDGRFILRLDSNLIETARYNYPAPGCQGLTWDGNYLWSVDVFEDCILAMETKDNGLGLHRFYTTDLGYMCGIAWDGTHIWITEHKENTLRRLRNDLTPPDFNKLIKGDFVNLMVRTQKRQPDWIPWGIDFLYKLGYGPQMAEALPKLLNHEDPVVSAAASNYMPRIMELSTMSELMGDISFSLTQGDSPSESAVGESEYPIEKETWEERENQSHDSEEAPWKEMSLTEVLNTLLIDGETLYTMTGSWVGLEEIANFFGKERIITAIQEDHLRHDERSVRNRAKNTLRQLGGALTFDRSQDANPGYGSTDSDFIDLSLEAYHGDLFATWDIFLGSELFQFDHPWDSVLTFPTFAKLKLTVAGGTLAEPIRLDFDAEPGNFTDYDVEVAQGLDPGIYKLFFFIHVQYFDPDGNAKVINSSGPTLEVEIH